jgi:hypothetical protein
MGQRIYLLLITLAALCLIGWTGYSQTKAGGRTTWEFTSVSSEAEANKLGAQGWDLVTVGSNIDVRDGSGQSYAVFYLKRAKQ